MTLSIITINLNNLSGFIKTYNSILSQSFQDFEWIVIDGGSTDGSKEFIKNNEVKFTTWCSEPDGGIYQALNKGVSFSHGEFICFMNAGDCFADGDVLQKTFSKQYSSDILYGNALFVTESSRRLLEYPDFISFNWLRYYTINHQSSFTRRRVFDKLNFDTKYKYLADRKFWMQSMLAGFRFEHLPFTVAHYDFCGFSTQNKDKWEDERVAILEEVIPDGLKENILNGYIFETHKDLQKAYSILQKHGPCRKILHCCIKILCRFMSR